MFLTAPETEALLATLPSLQRLALAYAPVKAREPTLALFALDARLANVLRHSREPMMAQLRLAWWRENLQRDAAEWPSGEPLLRALTSWGNRHQTLTALIDGWEALTGPAPLGPEPLAAMADGRGAAFAALAAVVGKEADAAPAGQLGRGWALADLATRLGHPLEGEAARTLLLAEQGSGRRLSRAMRPLTVLHGLALRQLGPGIEASANSPALLFTALRLGLLGR